MVLNPRASPGPFIPRCSIAEALAQTTSLGELNLTFSSSEAEREGGLNQ